MRVVPLLLLAVLSLVSACEEGTAPPPKTPPQPPTKPAPPQVEDAFELESATPMDPKSTAPDKVLGAKPVARLHLIDVGQGAATLFEFSCAAVLIDTGGEQGNGFDSAPMLRRYLEAFFRSRPDLKATLDLLVLTHPHVDHTRNAQLVAEGFTVKNVVTDGRTTGSGGKEQTWLQEWAAARNRLETVLADKIAPGGHTSGIIDPVKCEDVDPSIRVLWGGLESKPAGWDDEAFKNANNQSVVVRIDAGHASFMVSGDLEVAGMESVLAKHGPSGVLDVDVWEVSHHGARNGTTPAFAKALSPSIALIAMGAAERHATFSAWAFGHPRKDIVSILEGELQRTRRDLVVQLGTAAKTFEPYTIKKAIYATGWDGSVIVSASSEGKYRVQTMPTSPKR